MLNAFLYDWINGVDYFGSTIFDQTTLGSASLWQFLFHVRNVNRLSDIAIQDYVIIWTLSNLSQPPIKMIPFKHVFFVFFFHSVHRPSRNEHGTNDLSAIINTLNVIAIEMPILKLPLLFIVWNRVCSHKFGGNLLLFIVHIRMCVAFRYKCRFHLMAVSVFHS